MTVLDFFPGWKTYAAGLGLVVVALAPGISTLDPSLMDWNQVLEGLAIIFLRKGIKTRA